MIKLIKPYISFDEVRQDFEKIFESGWFTKGAYVTEFRNAIAEYTGAKHAYLTTSATTALEMALKLLKVGEGDEIIVSDFSFPASVNVIEEAGATPVFADVSLDTFNMLPEELENKITPKTRAVMFVDALGNPSGIHKIKEICNKYSLPLIEDAACAIGSDENGLRCGNIADITCFSFHPRKLLTTGEGGAITLNCDHLAKILEIKLNHGAVFADGKMDFVDYGYNYRLPDLQCVMGIKQVAKLDTITASRNAIRERYIEALSPLGFVAQQVGENVSYNVQSLVFRVPEGVDRDQLIAQLREQGIESTLGTYCQSNTTYYRKKYDTVQPNSLHLERNSITLPCHEDLDIEYVFDTIKKIVNG